MGARHLDGRGGSGNEFASLGAIKSDPDRNTLGQPHPVESRIDVGEEGYTGATIAIFDTGRDAFHSSVELNEVTISLLWHASYDNDPAHIWLRELVTQLAAEL